MIDKMDKATAYGSMYAGETTHISIQQYSVPRSSNVEAPRETASSGLA